MAGTQRYDRRGEDPYAQAVPAAEAQAWPPQGQSYEQAYGQAYPPAPPGYGQYGQYGQLPAAQQQQYAQPMYAGQQYAADYGYGNGAMHHQPSPIMAHLPLPPHPYGNGYGMPPQPVPAHGLGWAGGPMQGGMPHGAASGVHGGAAPTIIDRPGERTCRTLFVRNLTYQAKERDVYESFAPFGEIKTVFDMIATRGIVFVTYFDLRSAEKARIAMQDYEFLGRKIDVHYSLPKAEDMRRDRSGRDKNQGSVQIELPGGGKTASEFSESEVYEAMAQFGEIREIRDSQDGWVEWCCMVLAFFWERERSASERLAGD
nr:hypothetical protein HK105_001567 [Polyrhizophydium stewartii]